MFEPGPDAMGESAGAVTSAPTVNPEFGSLLSELTGAFHDGPAAEVQTAAVEPQSVAAEPEAPPSPVALLEAPKPAPAEDSGSLLNELATVVAQPVSVEQPVETPQANTVTEPTPKEPEMTMSPPRIEPPAFFWKPQRRGFFGRRG